MGGGGRGQRTTDPRARTRARHTQRTRARTPAGCHAPIPFAVDSVRHAHKPIIVEELFHYHWLELEDPSTVIRAVVVNTVDACDVTIY